MQENYETFAVKLSELKCEYARLQKRLEACQRKSLEEIRAESESLRQECRQTEALLQKSAASAHSVEMASLSQAQLMYQKKIRNILERLLRDHRDAETQSELLILYAEYAVDFATQAMKHALLSAMSAIDFQMSLEGKMYNE